MEYKIVIEASELKLIGKWKKSNPVLFKKLQQIFNDVALHPRTGMGHPEPLVGFGDVVYSRRLSAHDRVIYEIRDDEVVVIVIQVGGHYSDK